MKTFIGIDGGKKTGFAAIRDGEIILLETWDFCRVTDYLRMRKHDGWIDAAKIFVEDPAQISPVFRRAKPQGNANAEIAIQNKIAEAVGGVKRESRLLIKCLRRMGYDVTPVKPARSKLNAKRFTQITGCTRRTNPHERDAAMLIWGR